MPSSRMAASSRTVTSTPSFLSTMTRLANSSGLRMFAGSLTSERAVSTPAATASPPFASRRTAAGSPTARTISARPLISAIFVLLGLVMVEPVFAEPHPKREFGGRAGRILGGAGRIESDGGACGMTKLAHDKAAEAGMVEGLWRHVLFDLRPPHPRRRHRRQSRPRPAVRRRARPARRDRARSKPSP